MSAFIVDNTTINGIVAFVERHHHDGSGLGWTAQYFLRNEQVAAAAGPEGEERYDRLGQALYALNVRAVAQRYPGESIDQLPGPITCGYRWEPSPVPSPVQAFKFLQCLLYQCSEGTIPTTPLYQALVTLKSGIADTLIDQMPEYQRAVWG